MRPAVIRAGVHRDGFRQNAIYGAAGRALCVKFAQQTPGEFQRASKAGGEPAGMLFPKKLWAGLEDGSVTLAFRRWQKPAARAGSTQRFAGGVLAFESVEPITLKAISAADAKKAGFSKKDELLKALSGEGQLYRIRLRYAGPDTRVELRQQSLSPEEIERLQKRLARWQALPILQAIRDHPGRRAPDLAASFGKETLPFKAQVRRLKELGLTESLRIGYRLSPRGTELLEQLER